MLHIARYSSPNSDFTSLVKLLDAELAERDGNLNTFYHQFNAIDSLKHIVIGYKNNVAISCGAINKYDDKRIEIKRMYTSVNNRGNGYASLLLQELEKWAAELGYNKCILETGKKQVEAIELYKKNNYRFTPNYGQYKGIDNSLCFEKILKE